MYFCYYQKIDLNYLFQKIRFGNKAIREKNDIQNSNLKGPIKSYKIISKKEENKIKEEIEFNTSGNFVRNFANNQTKIFKYYKNSKLSSCKIFNLKNELIFNEFYKYDDNWKLISKKVFDKKNYKYDYDEFYEYDLRKRITAIIKQFELNDDIQTLKYNKNGLVTDRYNFTNKTYNGRVCTKEKYKLGGKSKRVTRYTNENDILFDTNSLLNDKNDVISELSYNFLNFNFKNSSSTKSISYNYKYDKYDNWISRIKHFEGNLVEELLTEIEYYE